MAFISVTEMKCLRGKRNPVSRKERGGDASLSTVLTGILGDAQGERGN